MKSTKIVWFLSATILVLVGLCLYFVTNKGTTIGSAPGNQLIEQYLSYVLYNGGIKSALPIVTTSDITAAGLTTSSLVTTGDGVIGGGKLNITTSNTATSTLVVGCVQFYATSTATAHKFQASTTPGIMYSEYGTCPNL